MANKLDNPEVEVLYPRMEKDEPGIDLIEIKAKFIKNDKNNLYKTIFIGYSFLVMVLLIRVYFTTDFSKLGVLLNQDSKDAYFVSNQWFRIGLWGGLLLLFAVELAAFWQRKLHQINDISMGIFASAYGFALVYWATSLPLYQFLSSYYANRDPFKSFSTSFEVLQQSNLALLILSLIAAVLLFVFAFIFVILKRLNIRLIKTKL